MKGIWPPCKTAALQQHKQEDCGQGVPRDDVDVRAVCRLLRCATPSDLQVNLFRGK